MTDLNAANMGQHPSVKVGLVAVLWIITFAVVLSIPAILQGPVLGDSLHYNLIWLQGFDQQFWRGEIYPRWISNLWFGSGAPDFFFYAPLPFWISTVFGRPLCWGCDASSLLSIGCFFVLLIAGLGYFNFARRFVDGRMAILSALIYMALPYHLFMDWGIRQAFGEFTAIAIFPWIASFMMGVLKRERWAGIGFSFSIAALSLSHLPSTVVAGLTLPFLVLYYFVSSADPLPTRLMTLVRLSAFALLGLLLSAFYWLPAIRLLPDVASFNLWVDSIGWRNGMIFEDQPMGDKSFLFMLKAQVAITAFFMVISFTRLRGSRQMMAWFYIPVLVAVFFMTRLSYPLWASGFGLQSIQFPWRFMAIADFGLPLAAAYVLARPQAHWSALGQVMNAKRLGRPLQVLLALVILGGLGEMVAAYRVAEKVGQSREAAAALIADRISVWEYLPLPAFEKVKSLTNNQIRAPRSAWSDTPDTSQELSGASEAVQTFEFQHSSREWLISIHTAQPMQYTFKQFYWRLWQAVDLNTGRAITLRPDPKFGLIMFDVPSGESSIKIFMPYDAQEIWGFWLSAFALVGLGAIGLAALRKKSA